MQAKCGPPDSKEISSTVTTGITGYRTRDRAGRRPGSRGFYGEVTQVVETWTYDFGSHKFIYILRFLGDTLQSIDTGGYGSIGGGRDREPDRRPPEPSVPEPAWSVVNVVGWPDGAEVRIDGEFYGKIPSYEIEIPPGGHIVSVTMAGFREWKERVEMAAGEERTIHAILQPAQ